MFETRNGGCQCGQVRYDLAGPPIRVGVCYCQECRRHSGGAFSLSLFAREADFAITAGQVKRFTRAADSGRAVECVFCPDCGTRLFHVPPFAPGLINIKPGTLDDASNLVPTIEIFAAHRPAWLAITGLEESHQGQPW